MLDGFRQTKLNAYRSALEWNTATKFAAAAGFAGLLAMLSQISVPLPWTPVPFTMQVLGVYLMGAYLGPRYGLLSMGLYLAAGAIGFHVFAPSTNAYNPAELWSPDRWRILVPDLAAKTGYTAGYIFGWVGAAWLVGWWLSRRDARMDGPVLWSVIGALLVLLVGSGLAGTFTGADGSFVGNSAGAQYQASADTMWLMMGAFALIAAAAALYITRGKNGAEAIKLYAVFLAATAIIHIPGVIVLKLVLDWSWAKAFALGSTVFLPMDAVKAALAVLLSLPFLPTRNERAQLEQTHDQTV